MSKKVDTTPYQKTPLASSVITTPRLLGLAVIQVISSRPDVHVWWLRGPLGSGKTTSARAVARWIGISGVITSPTYTLRHVYRATKGSWYQLAHIDAYRIARPEEYEALGIREDIADEKTLLLVEWPERLAGLDWPAVGIIDIAIVPGGRRLTLRLPKVVAPSASLHPQRPSARRKTR